MTAGSWWVRHKQVQSSIWVHSWSWRRLLYHSVEVGVNTGSNQSPPLRVKAMEERILLLLVSIHLIRSITR
jgi:hypothetical protein